MDICSRFDGLACRDDDVSDIKRAVLCYHTNGDYNESDGDDACDGDELRDQFGQEGKPVQISLGESARFPAAASTDEEEEEVETALKRIFYEESTDSSFSCANSFPPPLKLVSAMKGSREKQGQSPRKLTVTWAPDVYDPPPTSVLHTVRGKKQQKSKKNNDNRRNGKKGQKGYNSRGGGAGGKDKKQFRRAGGSSDRCYKIRDAHETLVNPSDALDGFDVGSPNPYCGSSFLKKAPTRMHFSVAEAL